MNPTNVGEPISLLEVDPHRVGSMTQTYKMSYVISYWVFVAE